MSSSLTYKKIYVDSKFMTLDSKSTSDFMIELPETLHFDNNTSVFYVDDVSICHSWWTVEENLNNKLYMLYRWLDTDYPIISTITPGNYTAPELVTAIRKQVNEEIGRAHV